MEGGNTDQDLIGSYFATLDQIFAKIIDCMHDLDSYYFGKSEKPLIHFDIYTSRVVLSDMVGEYMLMTCRSDITVREIVSFVGHCRFVLQRMTASIGSLLDHADESCHHDAPALHSFVAVINEVEHSLDGMFEHDAPFVTDAD